MSDTQKAALEAIRALGEFNRNFYGSMARANLMLYPAIGIGVAGNLWMWLR